MKFHKSKNGVDTGLRRYDGWDFHTKTEVQKDIEKLDSGFRRMTIEGFRTHVIEDLY